MNEKKNNYIEKDILNRKPLEIISVLQSILFISIKDIVGEDKELDNIYFQIVSKYDCIDDVNINNFSNRYNNKFTIKNIEVDEFVRSALISIYFFSTIEDIEEALNEAPYMVWELLEKYGFSEDKIENYFERVLVMQKSN